MDGKGFLHVHVHVRVIAAMNKHTTLVPWNEKGGKGI